MTSIKIDLNNPIFQEDLFKLEKNEQITFIKTLKKIHHLTWEQLYADHGLKWELILSKQTQSGERLYSFRFSKKYRAIAFRQDNFLRLLALHTDHDSAYS